MVKACVCVDNEQGGWLALEEPTSRHSSPYAINNGYVSPLYAFFLSQDQSSFLLLGPKNLLHRLTIQESDPIAPVTILLHHPEPGHIYIEHEVLPIALPRRIDAVTVHRPQRHLFRCRTGRVITARARASLHRKSPPIRPVRIQRVDEIDPHAAHGSPELFVIAPQPATHIIRIGRGVRRDITHTRGVVIHERDVLEVCRADEVVDTADREEVEAVGVDGDVSGGEGRSGEPAAAVHGDVAADGAGAVVLKAVGGVRAGGEGGGNAEGGDVRVQG